jgi:hypothetical protein
VPDVVEPGARLVDRYRLEEHLDGLERAAGEPAGTTYWRAHDELLDRPVGVCLLRADGPDTDRVLRAARRAAALTDSRFLRVLDASEVDGTVYVVSEWVRAANLVDLLADGPLPAPEARHLAAEIAAALAAAHEAGLHHLCLTPEHVLRTSHGQVKLAGLAVDAAVRAVQPVEPADAARLDTQGAAAVLYSALTGRWPGSPVTQLPPAPLDGSGVCSPRQVRAGVPVDLDDIVCRALGTAGRAGRALDSPAALAAELATASVTSRLPAVPRGKNGGERAEPYPAPVAAYDDAPVERSRAARLAWAATGLVVVVGLVLFGGQIALTDFGGGGDPAAGREDESAPEDQGSGPATRLEVASATGFDPPPDGNGEENSDRAGLAVDGKADTTWTTKTYFDPFGPTGLKDGVGLLLDLGEPTEVSRVTVEPAGGATDLEVRVADRAGTTVEDFELLDQVSSADGPAVLRPDEPVTARYVLVWLTGVPAVGDSSYRGAISEVALRG